MAYQDDALDSERKRQVAKAGQTSQAVHRQADIDHFTRLLAAEIKWGVSNNALGALRSLGADPGSAGVAANNGIVT